MNTKKRIVMLSVLAIGLGLALAAQEAVFAVGEWAPYTGEKLPAKGMAVELVNAACKAAGLTPAYQWTPWKRAESYVLDGTVFATFPYTDIKERQGKYLFSDALFSSSFGILVNTASAKTKDFKYASADSFKGFAVGLTAGTDAVKLPLEKAGAKVEEAPDPATSIKKLDLGRLDFVIDDKAVLFAALKDLGATVKAANLVFLDKPFGEVTMFKVMVSLKAAGSQDLLKKFNAGLAAIRSDGSYAAILAKYGLSK